MAEVEAGADKVTSFEVWRREELDERAANNFKKSIFILFLGVLLL